MLTLRLTKYILLMNSWLLEYKFYFLCRGDRCAFHNQMHLIQTMISFVISDSDILETVEKADFVEFLGRLLKVGWVWRRELLIQKPIWQLFKLGISNIILTIISKLGFRDATTNNTSHCWLLLCPVNWTWKLPVMLLMPGQKEFLLPKHWRSPSNDSLLVYAIVQMD